MNKSIVIIGAGLSGLYLGYQLKKQGFTVKILEANDRIGGRIFTKSVKNTTIELGATWLWKYNTELWALCKALNIDLFEQNMTGDALFEAHQTSNVQRFKAPVNQEISYRIVGGTASILNKLASYFSESELFLNQKVITVKETGNTVAVITENSTFSADVLVATLPPQVLVNTIRFFPELDKKLVEVANNTHTWMKDAIKFAVIYKTPFWKEKGLSGAGFSNSGPFTEIYEHSDFENKTFALVGFLHGNLRYKSKEQREQLVSNQLLKFFGVEGKDFRSYEEKIWSEDVLANFKNNMAINPHANNGHSLYQKTYFNEKLIIAGSETALRYGGYMEGAISRGNQLATELKERLL